MTKTHCYFLIILMVVCRGVIALTVVANEVLTAKVAHRLRC